MKIFEAFILGMVQGLTEFIPVSSSGHLLLLEKFGIGSPSVFFNLALHAGTLAAACAFYRKNVVAIIKKPFGREGLSLLAATAVTGVLGLFADFFLNDILEGRFLAAGFMLTSVIILCAETLPDKNKQTNGISPVRALVCGLSQGIAVIPGLSRSGATISALLFMNTDREKAANFSFLLSMPVILAGFILEVAKNRAWSAGAQEIPPVMVGMLTAAVSGFFAVKGFVKFLKKRSMKSFAYYTAALAAACLFFRL
ncbi:MAG: undecaprenyl-diphosphate phosphatase [Clostridiales bacterium]|jgi:undecaprenyl-diphosphatase|nr:undecaprenyl-diphosphate phosphatase [Clostridiales bacterium]